MKYEDFLKTQTYFYVIGNGKFLVAVSLVMIVFVPCLGSIPFLP